VKGGPPKQPTIRYRRKWWVAFGCLWLVAVLPALAGSSPVITNSAQGFIPNPPTDLTRVYYLNPEQQLLPLPFESGSVSLNVFIPAAKDTITRVQVTGAGAETVIAAGNPTFYVFVGDKMDPPPHQLVRLGSYKSKRELRISVIKGRKGYAPFAEDTIKLERQVLKRLEVSAGKGRSIFVNYMRLRPVSQLAPGEYAIVGDSLSDMATFRIK
jgi:hypothetical protein